MAAATGVLVRSSGRPRLSKKTLENVAAYLALAFFLVIAVFPVFWMLMTSLKADRDLVNPTTPPSGSSSRSRLITTPICFLPRSS